MSLPLTSLPRLLGGRGQGELAGPVVIGVAAGAVVGVGHAAQPRIRGGAGPRVLNVLGVATRACEEVRHGGGAVVGHDLARGRGHRRIRRRCLGSHALIHLRARVRIQVVEPSGNVGRDRVRPRRDRLGVERLSRPRRRHLGRDHAAHIVVEAHRVDGVDAARAIGAELERAAIRTQAGKAQRARTNRRQRRRERPDRLARRLVDDFQGPVRQRHDVVGQIRVQPLATDPSSPRERRRPAPQQDPNGLRRVRRAECGARVVVAEDLLIGPAVQRIAVGAVLTHPDPVAVPAPADVQRGRRITRGWGGRVGALGGVGMLGRGTRGQRRTGKGQRRRHRQAHCQSAHLEERTHNTAPRCGVSPC